MKSLLAFLLLLPALQAETLTNQGVIQLVKAGTSPDDILRAISTAPVVSFQLTDMDSLLRAGVSEDAIKIMAARQNGSALLPADLPPDVMAMPMPLEGGIGTKKVIAVGVAATLLQLLLFRRVVRVPVVIERNRRRR